jgi:hypothetical protein
MKEGKKEKGKKRKMKESSIEIWIAQCDARLFVDDSKSSCALSEGVL